MTLVSLVSYLIGLIQLVIPVLTGAAVVLFMFGVFQYVYAVAQGSKEASKEMMWWGMIALFVIFSFWGILALLQRSLNLP